MRDIARYPSRPGGRQAPRAAPHPDRLTPAEWSVTQEWMAFFRDPDRNILAVMSQVRPSE